MNKIISLVACFCMTAGVAASAGEIDYSHCESLQDVIAKETCEIADTNSVDHDELAQLYVSRGESHLIGAQYEKALEDFQCAYSHLEHSRDSEAAEAIAFRATFGEVISCDNLGLYKQTWQAIERLQKIVDQIGCDDCIEHRPHLGTSTHAMHLRNMIATCRYEGNRAGNQDNYDDIVGPNQPPDSDWCEEVVVGTALAMQTMAALTPNRPVMVILMGVIEALKQRGLKCCQAREFWKACVAPVARKWKEWKDAMEKFGMVPDKCI